MSDVIGSPDRILRIFKYCQIAFNRVGINVSFPKNTDPSKTYKWRYLENFDRRISDLQVSDDTILKILNAIVDHAVKHKQLRKGLALLAVDQILDIGLKAIEGQEKASGHLIDRLQADHDFVGDKDPAGKDHNKALPNLVKWYMTGQISKQYLTVSRKCHAAMIGFDRVERSLLPPGKELVMLRMEMMGDDNTKRRIMYIMGDDYRSL